MPEQATEPPECPCCPDGCRDPHGPRLFTTKAGCAVHPSCRREYRDRALKKIEEAVRWATNDHHCKPPLGNPTREEAIRELQIEREFIQRLTRLDVRLFSTIKRLAEQFAVTPRFVVTPEMREKVAISMYAIARGDTPFLVSETYWSRYSADALWKRRFYKATDCILIILGTTVSAEQEGK